MKTLSSNNLKLLKVIHLLCAFMWIGGAFGIIYRKRLSGGFFRLYS